MPHPGSTTHVLLHDFHADGCDGQEYSTCRPVAWGTAVAIVYCEWCGECGAADYDLVSTLDGVLLNGGEC